MMIVRPPTMTHRAARRKRRGTTRPPGLIKSGGARIEIAAIGTSRADFGRARRTTSRLIKIRVNAPPRAVAGDTRSPWRRSSAVNRRGQRHDPVH